MDDKGYCDICKDNTIRHLRICLRCHQKVCVFCVSKHKNSDHSFRIPDFVDLFGYINSCKKHYKLFDNFCETCSTVICRDCLKGMHYCHKVRSLADIANEKRDEAKRELLKLKTTGYELQSKINDRYEWERKMNEKCKTMLAEIYRVERIIQDLKHDAENMQDMKDNPKLSTFFDCFKMESSLKLCCSLETNLGNIIERTSDRPGAFLNAYSSYLDFLKTNVTYPQVGDEVERLIHLDIAVEIHPDEDIRKVLPRFFFQSSDIKQFNGACKVSDDRFHADKTENAENTEKIKDLENKLTLRSAQLNNTKQMLQRLNKNISLIVEFLRENGDRRELKFQERSDRIAGDIKQEEIDEDIRNEVTEIHKLLQNISLNLQRTNSGDKTVHDAQMYRQKIKTLEHEVEQSKEALNEIKQKYSKSEQTEITTYPRDESLSNRSFVEQRDEEIQRVRKMEDELRMSRTNVNSLTKRLEDTEQTKREMRSKLEDKKKEIEDLKNRLSQVAGTRLLKGNASIADLGDKYRPTRIAEMYSEMYDNEWTEAVDYLTELKWKENSVVNHLFITLQACYRSCQQLAAEHMDAIVSTIFKHVPAEEMDVYCKSHITEVKQLMDARKGVAMDTANVIVEDIARKDAFINEIKRYYSVNEGLVKQIIQQPYFVKCTVVCWLMVVQDPPMVFDEEIPEGRMFEKDMYRHYTKSGEKILFSVWPAMFLHQDGPLLVKGVAQCTN